MSKPTTTKKTLGQILSEKRQNQVTYHNGKKTVTHYGGNAGYFKKKK